MKETRKRRYQTFCSFFILDWASAISISWIRKIRNARKKLSSLNLVDETAEEEDDDGQQLVVVGNEVGEDEDEEKLPGVLLSIGQRCLRHLQI